MWFRELFQKKATSQTGNALQIPIEFELPLEMHGEGVGRKAIYPKGLNENSIVYSFGVGQDASFDLSLIQKYGLRVFAFDPTPETSQWMQKQNFPEQFQFHAYGLAAVDGEKYFYPKNLNPGFKNYSLISGRAPSAVPILVPVKRFQSILSVFGHKRIDLMKIDIEGAEIDVLPDVLNSEAEIDQLHIEFHHSKYYPVKRTETALARLKKHGYRICSAIGRDVSFVKSG